MFDKTIPMKVSSYQIIDPPEQDQESFDKIARTLDFPPGVTYDPDYVYLWIRIVSAGEFYGPNKNGDYFPLKELVRSYETFRDAHPFKNHENKDIAKAIGRIFDVRYDDEMVTVEVFKAIDKKVAPEIARGYQKGYLTDVSMGCKVPYTVCSVCGNKARRASEFCGHVKHHRLEYLETGERVYEINFEPRFHDSSVVLNGAERVAKAFMIIDSPSASQDPAFRKVAKAKGLTHYLPLDDNELEKVAAHREALHPMLQVHGPIEKVAAGDMLQKLAELEKELTGKLIAGFGEGVLAEGERAANLMRIIRFLTDERMGDDNAHRIADSLKALADAERAPVTKVFATFLGIAELLGITLYPNELHTIMRGLTASGLDPRTEGSTAEAEVYPTEVEETLEDAAEATKMLPKLDDPSRLVHLYDKAPLDARAFGEDPVSFFRSLPGETNMDADPSTRLVSAIRDLLGPILPKRGGDTASLLPRISIILSGARPLVGNGDVARDLKMIGSPETMGDLMGAMGYRAYETARPSFRMTRMVRLADERLASLEKTAAYDPRHLAPGEMANGLLPDKGIGRLKLLALGLPAAYTASAFIKSKENNGEALTSGERFVADHPGMIGIGGALIGKPLTAGAAKGVNAVADGVLAGGQKVSGMVSDTGRRIKDFITKESAFNLFDDTFIAKVAAETGAAEHEVRLLKVAALLESSGNRQASDELTAMFGVGHDAVDGFLRRAMDEAEAAFDKAAGDFVNNLVIDSVMDARPLSTSIPGRLVDAFVFKKLMDGGKPKEGEGNPNEDKLRPKPIEPAKP